MTYSPECVAAFEAKFPPGHGVTFNAKMNAYESESAVNESQAILSTDQLEGFAHNWERVRELENLIVHASVHSAYPECGRDEMSSDERALFDEVLGRHRKLLEKGNE